MMKKNKILETHQNLDNNITSIVKKNPMILIKVTNIEYDGPHEPSKNGKDHLCFGQCM